MSRRIVVTGGAGFIGSNLVRLLVTRGCSVLNLDSLTYAGNLRSLADLQGRPGYAFARVDIRDLGAVRKVLQEFQPDAVVHLAAESHVDRSIDGPRAFVETNVVGTMNLLEASLECWRGRNEAAARPRALEPPHPGPLPRGGEGSKGASPGSLLAPPHPSPLPQGGEGTEGASPGNLVPPHPGPLPRGGEGAAGFRFLHVSTDEVYGSLGASGCFTETSRYDPHSPYSASKAASDHLVRSWHDTYGLPVLVTSCSNNYGPYQFPEKLVPLVILKCLRDEPIPVYGTGEHVRDWLYVEDHCRALVDVLERGRIGETYNIGANNEWTNLKLVQMVCGVLDELHPAASGEPYAAKIQHVEDRPGHDRRYAIDAAKIREELGWHPQVDFRSGLQRTVRWYLENRGWWGEILSGEYRMERLGKRGIS